MIEAQKNKRANFHKLLFDAMDILGDQCLLFEMVALLVRYVGVR
jgi:hypothetical protein